MNILHIETSTPVCSVALSINGDLTTYKDHHEANIHASKLTLFIQEVLDAAHCAIDDLDAIAVSKGPGSYTGLRIGVSVAKGLCYALDIPLIAVPTLDAMVNGFLAAQAVEYADDTLFCPMIDARRMEVYTAVYNSEMQLLEPIAARIIDESSFDKLLRRQSLILFGDGATKFKSLFEDRPSVQVYTGFLNSARYMVGLAYIRYGCEQFEDVAYFEPFYLKDFIPTTPKPKNSMH